MNGASESGSTLPAWRRFWLAGVVALAALILIPFSFNADQHLETATRMEGSEAETVSQELASRFHSPFVNRVVLVIQGLPPADSEAGEQALGVITAGLKEEPGVSGVVSRLELRDPIFLGSNGGTFVLVGLNPADGSIESMVPRLRVLANGFENQLRGQYPKIQFELTGETPLNFDLRKASKDDIQHAESLVVPLTLGLLLLAFGSVAAAVIPLAAGELAISMTMAIAGFLAERLHLSVLVQSLATMLGLGLGIDYALLMVKRFREAMGAGKSKSEASQIAAKHAGHTLLISASTVAIGFAALLTVPISEVRSIGVAGFLVAGTSVLLANTLAPAVLAMLGTRLDAGRMPFAGRLCSNDDGPSARRWRSWGRTVVAHPWLALGLASAPLLLLASQAIQLDTSLPRGDWLPAGAESVHALHSLEKMGRAGIVESLRVVLELPAESIAQSDAGWNALDRVTKQLGSDKRADRAISLTTLAEGNRAFVSSLARETRRTFLSGDGHAAFIELLPASTVSPTDQVTWVRELRRTDAAALTGIAGARILVGGIPALNGDYQSIVKERFPHVMVFVVGGTLVALLLGFRSVFAALKAILLNVLSVAAAFGALVLVFQQGYGSRIFGVPDGTGSVFPIVPILAFAIVFGLSMDYEVFLVARVLEARRGGLSETEAIPEGMARTSGLITSAATIMIVVFAAFTFGNFLVIKMLGFTLAVAVFLDATLVRMVVGPALLRVAGDWNWWPWGLSGAVSRTGPVHHAD